MSLRLLLATKTLVARRSAPSPGPKSKGRGRKSCGHRRVWLLSPNPPACHEAGALFRLGNNHRGTRFTPRSCASEPPEGRPCGQPQLPSSPGAPRAEPLCARGYAPGASFPCFHLLKVNSRHGTGPLLSFVLRLAPLDLSHCFSARRVDVSRTLSGPLKGVDYIQPKGLGFLSLASTLK